jgi:hypothetical protein
MSNGLDQPYGAWKAPRIPLDLRCILLATAGYLAVFGLDHALRAAFGHDDSPVAQMLGLLAGEVGRVAFLGDGFRLAMDHVWGVRPFDLTWPQAFATTLAFFAVWAVFGGAMLRCSVLRLTRDEPLSIADALRFGGRSFKDFLLVPVLVALFAAFFSLLNVAAGFVMSLWFVGSSLLAIVLFPLVLLSSLLVILAVVGGLVGLPLMWAGIAAEQNGALEAVSRAFSYVSARPFRFFFANLLIFVLMSAVTLVGRYFEDTVKTTLKGGIVRAKLDDVVSEEPRSLNELQDPYERHEVTRRRQEGIANLHNIGNAPLYDKPGFFWMWLCLSVFLLGFKGYALYVFLGGTASLYLQLRHDVDGTDEEEVFLEGGDAAPTEPEPRWVAEGGPAAGEAPPPPTGAGS